MTKSPLLYIICDPLKDLKVSQSYWSSLHQEIINGSMGDGVLIFQNMPLLCFTSHN